MKLTKDMFNAWFVIRDDKLYVQDYFHGTLWGNCELWGRKIGGRWCLDYSFKLCFRLSTEYWETKCNNLKTNKDLYNVFEDLGIPYMRIEDNLIHYKGKLYDDKTLNEINK